MQWKTNKLKELRDQYVAELLVIYGEDDANTMLNMLIEGRRLRDISDLPFDLAT